MSEIPEQYTFTKEDLANWYEMSQELRTLRAKESALRKQIFGAAFDNPVEGTNNHELDDGYVLKAKYPLTRTIDEGALAAITEKLTELGVHPDSLVKYKPELKVAPYRKLNDEQRKLFDQALIIKPGSPTLEIVLPAKNKKA